MINFTIELAGLEQLATTDVHDLAPDTPETVADFTKATNLLAEGRSAQATDLCLRLLAARPIGLATATHSVLLLRKTGRTDLAMACQDSLIARLQHLAHLHPGSTRVHLNIGIILMTLGCAKMAEAVVATAVQNDPLNVSAVGLLSIIKIELSNPEGAEAVWSALFAAEPGNGVIRLYLVRCLAGRGFLEQAKRVLDLAEPLCHDIRNEFQYLADGIRGADSTKNQVAMAVDIFDGFSMSYDTALAKLQNQGPKMVGQVLERLQLPKNKKLQVLDAGCGTGLCAPMLQPLAKVLHGCDLSIGMLKQAKKKGCYTLLTRSDLASIGTMPQGPFDLIVTSDVLVYFGDLSEVFANFAKIARPGAWLIVTVEDAGLPGPARGWELVVSGRYKHSLGYLGTALAKAGFSMPKHVVLSALRNELGTPVPGLGFATQRLSLLM